MAWAKNGTPVTLSSSGATMTISDQTSTKCNVFLSHVIGVASSSGLPNIRVGNGSVDSGSNYANRMSQDGGADGTFPSETYIFGTYAGGSPYDNDKFQIVYGLNIGAEEKLFILFGIDFNAAGAGSAPSRQEVVAKWANTSVQYDNVQEFGTSYDTGSNLSALGSELTPASATTIETGSIYIDTDINGRWWFNGTNWISPYGDYFYTFDTDPTGSSPQTYVYVDTANSWWYGYSGTNLTSSQGQYIDLGSDLSTDWTMAFKVLTNQDGNTNALNAIVGLILGSTTGTDYNNSVHDFVNLWFNTDSSNRRDIRFAYGINSVSNSAIGNVYLVDGTGAYGGDTLPDATNITLYCVINKSGTTVTAKLYTDSALQNQYGVTGTLTSVTVSGLRYLKLMGRTASGTDNQVIVKIQSVQIKDGDANWTPSWIEG